MFTVLWCYRATPTSSRVTSTTTNAADLTGQANHLGVTIEADIIKQKLPPTTAVTTLSSSARPARSSTRR